MDRTYTHEEASAASLEYFGGDQLPSDAFCGKYALQDLTGNLYELTPTDMHHREAREFARIEGNYPNPMSEDEIFELFADWTVVPQGSPMSAVGNPFQVQSMSNCFVVASPHDSYGGIMRTDEEQAQIMKRRGGVGFDISTIRPVGSIAANAARTTAGIAAFMERYSNTCREVGQGGRRGALMLTNSVHHPEVNTFTTIKHDLEKVTGANVSHRLTDEFMRAAVYGENGGVYQQRFPVDKDVPHIVERDVDANEVWLNIVSAARNYSEPGAVFWDTIKRMTLSDAYESQGFGTVSCNPCAEILLNQYGSCILLLVNISKFVIAPFTSEAHFDFISFANVVQKAQRLIDDLVDLELEAIDKIIKKVDADPEPEDVKSVERNLWVKIRDIAAKGRRTGLGITALGDAIAYCNMGYATDASIEFTEQVYKTLALSAHRSSINLAKERGTFPIFDRELERNHPHLRLILDADPELNEQYELHGRRNICCTTTPPAGSSSILTQTTSGFEPVLFLKSRRKRKINPSDKSAHVDEVDALGDKWQYYHQTHPGLALWTQITGEIDITKSPYYDSTTEKIDWLKKVDMQAAAQKWVDHAISNTTTLPKDVTTETVAALVQRAWEKGCKGVTVYRIGSRDGVIVDEASSSEHEQPLKIVETHAPKRPKELECDVHRVSIKGQQYIVFVGMYDGTPYEVFAGLSDRIEVPKKVKRATLIKNGKKDGIVTYNLAIPMGDGEQLLLKDIVSLFDNPEHGSLTRMISLSLRHGTPVNFLVEQLKKDKRSDMTSFSGVIARVLKGYIKDGTKETSEKVCPECGASLVYQNGCVACSSCPWSRCG